MKNEQNAPKIRFKGFTDAWELRKFSDIAETRRGLTYKPTNTVNNGVRVLRSSNINEDTFVFGNEDVFVDENAVNIPFVQNGDILITSANGSSRLVGKHAIIRNLPKSSAVHGGFMLIASCSNPDFLNASLGSQWYSEFLSLYVAGGNGAIGNLNKNDLDAQAVLVPSTEEQRQIGTYFRTLDHLITLHQRKCETLQKLKKSMLQKMFPKNGSCFPEIRFAGFTDAWELRKVGEWGSFYYGHSCPKWSVTKDATTPCIRYGEMYTKFGCKIDRVYSYTNIPKENLKFSKGTEVLVPRVGEDPMDYNHCTWLSLADVAIGEMISVYNTEQNPLFTAIMFNATLKYEFAKRVEGGSVTNLYYEKLLEIPVSFPSIEEQKEIANLFENIETLITLHQRKLETLKKLKKAMLQKMFI